MRHIAITSEDSKFPFSISPRFSSPDMIAFRQKNVFSGRNYTKQVIIPSVWALVFYSASMLSLTSLITLENCPWFSCNLKSCRPQHHTHHRWGVNIAELSFLGSPACPIPSLFGSSASSKVYKIENQVQTLPENFGSLFRPSPSPYVPFLHFLAFAIRRYQHQQFTCLLGIPNHVHNVC